jgi:predicted kinase
MRLNFLLFWKSPLSSPLQSLQSLPYQKYTNFPVGAFHLSNVEAICAGNRAYVPQSDSVGNAFLKPRVPSLTIITGTPGAGKTDLAKRLAASTERGAHIPGDLFFTFISRLIEPTDPDSHDQNTAVVLAMVQSAIALASRGYDVYLDAVLGPWFLPTVASELLKLQMPVAYVILRLPVGEALLRVKQRDTNFDEQILLKLHPQFEDVGPYEKHVLEVSGLTRDEVFEKFHQRRPGCFLDAAELAAAMEQSSSAKRGPRKSGT